jgi:hypothetical protein
MWPQGAASVVLSSGQASNRFHERSTRRKDTRVKVWTALFGFSAVATSCASRVTSKAVSLLHSFHNSGQLKSRRSPSEALCPPVPGLFNSVRALTTIATLG